MCLYLSLDPFNGIGCGPIDQSDAWVARLNAFLIFSSGGDEGASELLSIDEAVFVFVYRIESPTREGGM